MPEAPTPFTPLEGGCACGKLRCRLEAPPMAVNACHCTYCQRETGTAHATNYAIETENVTITAGEGEMLLVDTPGASGRAQKIARCGSCYIAIFSHYPNFGRHMRFVRTGTLDKYPEWLTPDMHIFTSTKLPWYAIPEGARSVKEQYDVKEVWSKENLERLAKVKERVKSEGA
ncbi:glutathione-dependent formaldehyde-activating enzyme [Rhizodiscina lignyota]|uniref:Glutathione-dependent formaldehyde-activating enzyme n=1 Tax=Rhizodiscina lignyota TaxID=1504668 RepID=A0A9P4I1N9_9PEZI|nr:glutathione-dependent formaldehyde-activating enzyme [Rhizodiscina lignyota]